MSTLKRIFKRNTHNGFFKAIGGFGLVLYRLYENRNHDIYSNGELTVIKKLASTRPATIIDGGANIGGYTQHIRDHIRDCSIYAFEPVESTYQMLADKHGNDDKVVSINKGLYKENCTKEINLFDGHTHSSLLDIEGIHYKPNSKTKIDLVKGDDFLEENKIDHVDFVKLDVEGAEYDALLGFENTLRQGRINAIQFEYGYINITSKKLLVDFYNFFESFGYQVGKIFPKNVEFRKYKTLYEDFIGPNCIAVKKTEKDFIRLLESKKKI